VVRLDRAVAVLRYSSMGYSVTKAPVLPVAANSQIVACKYKWIRGLAGRQRAARVY
jgi:hypothetical protein